MITGFSVVVMVMFVVFAVGWSVLLLAIGWRTAASIAGGAAILLFIVGILFVKIIRNQVVQDFGEGATLVQLQSPAPTIEVAPTNPKDIVQPADSVPAADRPAWTEQPGQRKGSVYEVAVKSGLFVTDAECQRGLEAAEREAVDEYLDDYLEAGASRAVQLDANFIHDHLRKSEYQETTTTSVGKMRQLHALLAFDDSARQMFRERWRRARVDRNLGYVVGGAGLTVALLAAAYGYLTMTTRRVGAAESPVTT